MKFLEIECATIQIAGGIILFLLCLKMIFPSPHDAHERSPHNEIEPFVVPLAVPLVAGPGVLAAVMIFSRQEMGHLMMIGAILIAWIASLLILLCSSFLKKILGDKGIIALERLMGLILILIAVQMFLSGLGSFLQSNHSISTPKQLEESGFWQRESSEFAFGARDPCRAARPV